MLKLKGYEIDRKIGKGTYATVYLAFDSSNKPVALKKLTYNQFKNGIPLNIIRELKLLKSLSSSFVVTLIDVILGNESLNKIKSKADITLMPSSTSSPSQEEEKYDLLFIFEYCPHDLAGLIIRFKEGIPKHLLAPILYMILNALRYLHNKGVIHRDVKPGNIMINSEGKVKLADLGLARQVSEKAKYYTGNVVTLWYRAPELLNGSKVYDEKVDIWALGCVFAEMIGGKPLFSADTEIKVLGKIKKYFENEFSGDDEEWRMVRRMLVENPKNRPSAMSLLTDGYFDDVDSHVKLDIEDSHEMEMRDLRKDKG